VKKDPEDGAASRERVDGPFGPPGSHLTLTGQVAVRTSDGDEHELPEGNVRLVLAALALAATPITRSELAEVVWGDDLPRSWEASLRNTISRLRSFLRERFSDGCTIEAVGGCWRLQLPDGALTDVEVARRCLDQAESAHVAGDPVGAESAALAVHSICARPFLPGEENDWVGGWRATLHRWRLRALDLLTEARLARGELAPALASAEEAARIEPYRELGHRNLLRVHLAASDRGAGLTAYERCRRILAESLGVPPSAETEALYLALLGIDDQTPGAGAADDLGLPYPALPPRPRFFTGRQEELAVLDDRWRAATRAGSGIVVLSGEPGIGKTWLALEAAHRIAQAGGTVLLGTCDETGVPYQPIVETLTSSVNDASDEELTALGTTAKELAVLVPALRARLDQRHGSTAEHERGPRRGVATGRDDEHDRIRLFEAVARAYTTIARRSPLAIVLDDLQWAGPETVALVRYLPGALRGARILLIITCRSGIDTGQPVSELLDDLRRNPSVTTINLRGLPPEEIAALASALEPTRSDLQHDELVRRIDQLTDGNPFLTVELLRSLARQPIGAAASGTIEMPGTVAAHIERRRRQLPPAGARCIVVGAVAGTTFDHATVCAVAGVAEEEAQAGLEQAALAQLIRPIDGPVPRWGFTHALIRDAVVHALGPTRRARLHAAIAELWCRRPDAPTRAEEILQQLLAAGELADRTQVHHVAMQAGQLALDEWAWETAERRFRTALAHAPDERSRARAHLAVGRCAAARGALEHARAEHLAAIASARSCGDPELFALAVLGLSGGGEQTSAWFASDTDRDLLEEALRRLRPETNHALHLRVMGQLAYALHRPHELEQRVALANEVVERARALGDEQVLCSALVAGRIAFSHPSQTEQRIVLANEVAKIASRRGDRRTLFDARLARLSDRAELGDRRGVDHDLAAARWEAEASGEVMQRWRVAAWHALLTIVEGDIDNGRRLSDEALALWDGVGNATALRTWGGHQLTWMTVTGRTEEASIIARAGVEQYGHEVPGYRCALALTLALSGALDEAAREVSTFLRNPGLEGWRVDAAWLCGAVTLAEAVALVGDRRWAAELLPMLQPLRWRLAFIGGLAGLTFWGSTATAVGLLLATLGRTEEALTELRFGAAACERFGATPWQQRALAAADALRAERADHRRE
jgi:DNA-binding SARP family transcriptional activator/tetratricopeptide (TPR) repeat protein